MSRRVASRERLNAALLNAGLKTQAALAERIADLEDLESPPSTTISKLFNGGHVEDLTLERVARALGVKAEDLYEDETIPVSATSPDTAQEPATGDRVTHTDAAGHGFQWRTWMWALVLFAGAGVFASYTLLTHRESESEAPVAQKLLNTISVHSRPVLAFAEPKGPRADEVAAELKQALVQYWPQLSLGQYQSAEQIPDGIDLVLRVTTEHHGRYTTMRIHASDRSSRLLVWSEVYARYTSTNYLAQRMQIAATALDQHYMTGAALTFPNLAAQEHYLRGMDFLDRARTELNIRRAQAAFQSALRQQPGWAQAHAGFCTALIQEHQWSMDTRKLDDAALECEAAANAAATSVEVLAAVGFLARKTGDLNRAQATLETALEADPDNVNALLYLSEVWLHRFMLGERPDGAKKAAELVDRAIINDPLFWKAPFTRARIHIISGEVDESIVMNARALELDANYQTYGNLGTAHMCAGNFEAAKDAYVLAKSLAPDFHVSDVHVGIGYYFVGDYEQAMAYFAKAIEKQENENATEHRLLGNYADALRNAGYVDEAIAAYEQALLYVEAMAVNGELRPTHRAHRAYYLAALGKLSPESNDLATRQAVEAELSDMEETVTDPSAMVKIVGARILRGEPELARDSYAKIQMTCMGYAQMPEMLFLAEPLKVEESQAEEIDMQ